MILPTTYPTSEKLESKLHEVYQLPTHTSFCFP